MTITADPACAQAQAKLFETVQVTPAGEYTFGIEGPAADLDGNLFVVNFGKAGTIGKLPAGAASSEKFAELPQGSVGNSIRFDRDGTMFVADYKGHNIFAFTKGSAEPGLWFHSDGMNQANDMTVARDGTIYASDRTGRVARAPSGGLPKLPTARRRARS